MNILHTKQGYSWAKQLVAPSDRRLPRGKASAALQRPARGEGYAMSTSICPRIRAAGISVRARGLA